MFSLGAPVLGLGGCAWCAWLWHDQHPVSVKVMFFSALLTLLGIVGLIVRKPDDEN